MRTRSRRRRTVSAAVARGEAARAVAKAGAARVLESEGLVDSMVAWRAQP